jgi:effector-binding domain-containing protein
MWIARAGGSVKPAADFSGWLSGEQLAARLAITNEFIRRNQMLSLPAVVERKPQPYIAVRARIALAEMKPAVDKAFQTLFGWLGANGVEPVGAAFFKYDLIDMEGKCEIEFAVPVAKDMTAGPGLVAGVLPAGRYAQVTWTGPYDALFDVNALLVGWAREKGLRWDSTATPEGERFAARIEIYENNPAEVDDPNDLVTTVAIKIAD